MARTSSVVGERIVIPVLPLLGLYTNEDARSCTTDCFFFILLTFANQKISIRRKSNIAIAVGNIIKMAAFYRILIT